MLLPPGGGGHSPIWPIQVYAAEQGMVFKTGGAYHLTEKFGWGVESIMVSDLPVYRRNAKSVRV